MLIGVLVDFVDGATVFEQGAGATEMYIIRSGNVRIVRARAGQERVVADLGPGDFFGEMAIFKPGPRSARAVAVGPVQLEAIDRLTFLQSMDEPDVQRILAEMARRIRESGEEEAT